jgi:hypothetical protein
VQGVVNPVLQEPTQGGVLREEQQLEESAPIAIVVMGQPWVVFLAAEGVEVLLP